MTGAREFDLDNYRIGRPLHQSDRESIFLAEQLEPFREVVIRSVDLPEPYEAGLARKLDEECQIAAGFEDEHLVALLDWGVAAGKFYCVTEYLSGGTLADRLEKPIDVYQAIDITRSIASGLRYLHERGYVHRDVKPSNILFNEHDEPMLGDFGIAKSYDARGFASDHGITESAAHYMSPEEIQGEELDARSDFYSLGVIMYEMLTGEPPFRGYTEEEIRSAHLHAPPEELPEELARFQPVVNGLLARQPGDRFESAGDLIAALQQDRSTADTKPIEAEDSAQRTTRKTTDDDDFDQHTTRRFVDGSASDVKETRRVSATESKRARGLVWIGIIGVTAAFLAISVWFVRWLLAGI